MNERQDPTRLLEQADIPDEVRQVLEGARADRLPRHRVERVAAGVVGAIGPAGGGGGTAGPAAGSGAATGAATAGLHGLTRGLVYLAAAGTVAGGTWLAVQHTSDSPSATETVASASAAPAQVRHATVPVASKTSPGAPKPSASAMSHPKPVTKPEPSRKTTRGDKSLHNNPTPESLVEEHRLLRQARSALPSNPRRTLALTAEHRRRFPHGVLAQEREVLAIEALRKLGKQSEASSRASSFEKKYPDSPHRDQLDH